MNISSLLQGLASFAWLGFVGVLIMIFVRASRNQPAKGLSSLVVVLLVAAILLTSIGAGLVFLQANEYGVVISAFQPNGYRTQALGPGLHWIIPFIESVQKYSIAKQTYTMSSTSSEGAVQGDDSIQARTKDGQQIFVDASVIYAADPTQLIQLHITWQNRYEENVVRPVARAAICAKPGAETPTTTGTRAPTRARMRRTISCDSSMVSFCASPIIPRTVSPVAPTVSR